MTYTSESGHWYDAEGNPRYTILGANGRERPTTIRDARKLGYVPSVTTIIKCAAAPGLENWKIDQALLSALTLPRKEGESLDDFMTRAKQDSREQTRKAAEAGTALHGSLEKGFRGGSVATEHQGHWEAVLQALALNGLPTAYDPEKSFCSTLGYGGKVDLHCPGYVGDFKSKPSADIKSGKRFAYDEQAMQLAAYANGLGMPNAVLFNIYVGREYPIASIHVWEPSPVYFNQFTHLLRFWQAKNQMYPQIQNAA